MSNKYWTDKADNADEILAADFNAAFDAIEADIAAKVDKESGKGLSGNDYTDGDKAEVGKIANKADADKVYTKAEALNKLCPKHSASGYPIAITDALADEQPLKLLVYGNNIGDLDSGKYNIPITITGKNLFHAENPIRNSSLSYNEQTQEFTMTKSAVQYQAYDFRTPIPTGTAVSTTLIILSGNISNTGTLEVGGYHNGTPTSWQCNATGRTSGIYKKTFITTEPLTSLMVFCDAGAQIAEPLVFKVQFEIGNTATEYAPYKGKTVTAILDEPLSDGEYIDLVSKKRNGTTDITVNGDISLYDENNITCETATAPSKLDITYYQDINKVIANLTNAILAQGGNT